MPRMTLRSLMRAPGTAYQQVDFLQWYRASLNGTNLEEVAKLAYSYYVARGFQPGNPAEDWFRAVTELRASLNS